MLSIIQGIFLQFVNPLALVSVVLFLSLFLIMKKPKTAIWLIVIALMIIAVLGNTFFAAFLTRSVEWRYMPRQIMEPTDAILLMADGTLLAQTPRQRVEVEEEADRALYSAMYYQQELAPVIIVSGNASRAGSTKTLLLELGVPEEAIILQDQAANLRQDVSRSLEIIREREIKSVILVTSALKMDRTMLLLSGAGLTITPAPTDYQVTQSGWQHMTDWKWQHVITNLMPTSAAMEQSSQALWEYFSLAFYRLRAIF